MSDVLYAEKWNGLLMRPMDGWLDTPTAQSLYESPAGVMVVDAARRDQDGNPLPRWIIGTDMSGVRVQFFNDLGTRWRRVDYDGVDGRLWRWITADYAYADEARRWLTNETAYTVQTTVKPDGTGFFKVIDSRDPTIRPVRSTTPVHGLAKPSYWLERPAFGNWAALADPGPSAQQVAGRDQPADTH